MTDDTNPRTEVTDAVLAALSANIDGEAELDATLDLIERQTADATISGPGCMVDFDDYMSVTL